MTWLTVKFDARDEPEAKRVITDIESLLSRYGLRVNSVDIQPASDEELGPVVSSDDDEPDY